MRCDGEGPKETKSEAALSLSVPRWHSLLGGPCQDTSTHFTLTWEELTPHDLSLKIFQFNPTLSLFLKQNPPLTCLIVPFVKYFLIYDALQ